MSTDLSREKMLPTHSPYIACVLNYSMSCQCQMTSYLFGTNMTCYIVVLAKCELKPPNKYKTTCIQYTNSILQ